MKTINWSTSKKIWEYDNGYYIQYFKNRTDALLRYQFETRLDEMETKIIPERKREIRRKKLERIFK